MGQHRIAFIGWGAIARATYRVLADEDVPVEVVAVGVRDHGADRAGLPPDTRLLADPAELADVDADLVIELAGRSSVEPWGRAALSAGMDLAVFSVSAFAEGDLLDEFLAVAADAGSQVIIPPGALGGVDALVAARSMGIDRVEQRIIKPPKGWAGSEAEDLCDLADLTEPTVFFTGPAAEAAARFPKNANVTLTVALAGVGREHSMVTLIADPAADTNRHEFTATGAFGRLDMQIANAPLPENPKSSAMTALSAARLIRNRVAPLAI